MTRLPLLAVAAGALALALSAGAGETLHLPVSAAGFTLGTQISANGESNRLELTLDRTVALPYGQSALKQGVALAAYGPDPAKPYFTVRFAMPIPPENATNKVAALAGLDPQVFTHNHSPGFEILPNGDALAVYFSTPPGKSESDPETSFIQARLRYGAEDWDVPELFFKLENYNDQSGLLWRDGGKIWFFGGGRGLSDWVPFKMAVSTDNGASWTLSLPQLDQPMTNVTAQPITSAFRGPDQSIYFAMDGDKSTSLLWRSQDNGIHWHDMGGRTGGRHTVVVPLADQGPLLAIGGKNNSVDHWTPQSVSTDWGATWSKPVAGAFPPLGSAQRPSLIRLANGDLFFVSDAYMHKKEIAPPAGWKYGNDCFVAISTNQGVSWRVKPLPVQLPNHEHRHYGTVGYVTARQAPNGVIHVLTTETQPCLHYELNEAWIFSEAGDIAPETTGGVVKSFSESYPNGTLRSEWSARICPGGRYLLEGRETDYYDTGTKQHQVTYASGRKTGEEIFWQPDGTKRWTWVHDLADGRSVWVQFWPNGRRKLESNWNTYPQARDLKRSFFGLVADGPVRQWDETGRLTYEYLFKQGEFGGETTGRERSLSQ